MAPLVIITVTSFLFFISIQSAIGQEQQWATYENPYFGISIQHLSDWEVVSSNSDASPPPPRFAKQIVELSSPPELDAHLTIHTAIPESSLDTETMQVKNSTLEDFVEGKKSEIIGLTIPSGELDFQKKLVRDNKTTVAGIPAWRIESISSVMGMQGAYYINTLVMKDGHMFDLEFSFDSLKAAEALPIIQKMIDSFRITTPTQPPLNVPNTTDPLQQPGMPSNSGSGDLGQDTSGGEVDPISGLPETLIANDKISGEIRMSLKTAIINGIVQDMDLSKSFEGKLSNRNPDLVFKFANQPEAGYKTNLLTGPIKAYDSSEGILEEARYWENMTLNKEIPLEVAQVGSNYLIASVQFPGDIWGIYSTVLDVQRSQAMDTKPTQNRDGDNLSHGIDNSSISNQAIQQALSLIICSDLKNYGFQVCRQ